MSPKFCTSGLRGLAHDLTPDLVQQYVQAFFAVCDVGTGVYVGYDLRPSSPQLALDVQVAVRRAGYALCVCGPVSSPALALAAKVAGAGAIMVTGSHIPADRNGLKFYSTAGEITKEQETDIVSSLGIVRPTAAVGEKIHILDVMATYGARYLTAYRGALQSMRVGVFEHSAVGRDHLGTLLRNLGATVIPLGRSATFVPIDTEAVLPALQHQLRDWAVAHRLDAIVSTDADGDRPLLTDEIGNLVSGDVLGQITARTLGARQVVTPISSNTGVELSDRFDTVLRTKIGSPYVLAGMAQLAGDTVGYEANGGFILGFQAGNLAPLMTRDALLPICAVLALAQGQGVAALVAGEPARVTATDRLQDITPKNAADMLARLVDDPTARRAFLREIGMEGEGIDLTDGLRMFLTHGRTLHLRQSGNAPELRIYAEAGNDATAQALLASGMGQMRKLLDQNTGNAGVPGQG